MSDGEHQFSLDSDHDLHSSATLRARASVNRDSLSASKPSAAAAAIAPKTYTSDPEDGSQLALDLHKTDAIYKVRHVCKKFEFES